MYTSTSSVTRFLVLATSICAVAAFSGCDNDPAKGKTHASVSAPQPVAPPAESPAGAVEYAFSSTDSKLDFTGAKITGKHEGTIGSFRGTIRLVDGEPTKSTVSVEIEMASLQADAEKLTNHLKSPDFFDVTRYPTAGFVSTTVTPGGEGSATHTVIGNLELHGVTKSITFPAAIQVHADAVDVEAEFAINRKDFDVVYPGMPDDLIKDEILIRLKIQAKKS